MTGARRPAGLPTRRALRARLMEAIVTLLDDQGGVDGTWYAKPDEGAPPEQAAEHVRHAKLVAREFSDELARRAGRLRRGRANGGKGA